MIYRIQNRRFVRNSIEMSRYKLLWILIVDLSQYFGHDLREFFRDSDGRGSHCFNQLSNSNRLTAD